MGDLGIDGRILLKWILKHWWVGVMDWIDLAENWEWWWPVVNVAVNL